MRFYPALLLLCGLLLPGCPAPSTGSLPGTEAPACTELGELIAELQETEELLQAGGEWERCKEKLRAVMEMLDENVRTAGEDCNYLNQQNYPEHPRFMFVESLTDRILQDTLPDGLYYFVRLRGIFSDDAAISEYFSEELAHVALANPDSYLGYLSANPDQEVMLLYSTKWNYLDADTLIARFQRREGAGAVVEYLREWKLKNEDGTR